MANCRQSRRLLECIENNFLSPVIYGCTREDAILDLVLTNAEENVREVKIGGSQGAAVPMIRIRSGKPRHRWS